MALIKLHTLINAPIGRCFDLSRSIDMHMLSTSKTKEKAIAGITSGLIGLNETVTWRARHFGIYQKLTVKITGLDYPHFFEDTMIRGIFKNMRHEHRFESHGDTTTLYDHFEFEAPLGIFGKLAEELFLTSYMQQFLEERNRLIKETAESSAWKKFLPS